MLLALLGLAFGTSCGREDRPEAEQGTTSPAKQLGVQAVKQVFASADIPLSAVVDNDSSSLLFAPADDLEVVIYVVVWRIVSHRAPVDITTPATRREIGNVDVYVPETLSADRARALQRAITDLEKMLTQ